MRTSPLTQHLTANSNQYQASYQNGKYGFMVGNKFFEIGGGGMPILDFANPLHTFSTGNLSYTAVGECYICGTIRGQAIARNLVINGTNVVFGNSTNVYAQTYIPPLKIKSGDVVTIEADCPELHVYAEI